MSHPCTRFTSEIKMPLLSRRRFFVSTALFPLAARISLGQTAPPAPETNADLPAQTLYAIGTRLLREGRTFEKAAEVFALAAQKEPTNADFQIGLGCAYACRAASLSWAGIFADRLAREKAAHPKVMQGFSKLEEQLRQGQKSKKATDAETNDFNDKIAKFKAKLNAPLAQVIFIKDDKKPFALTQTELAAQLNALTKNALAAWINGVVFAKTPREKAEALFHQGWGMRLLRFYLDDKAAWKSNVFVNLLTGNETGEAIKPTFPLPLNISGLPTDAQIKAAFQAAYDLAPQNALYVQARADFAAFGETNNPGAEATELYRCAANLAPKNANVWNRVYDRETARRFNERQPDAPDALADLHRAQARDKSNAWYAYEEAGRIMETASWSREADLPYDADEKAIKAARAVPPTEMGRAAAKRAITLMERANNLPRFAPPVYQNSVPILLARAWNYVPHYWYLNDFFASYSRLQKLNKETRLYADSLAAEKKNEPEAVHALRVLLQMGLRLMGDPWPPADLVDEKNNNRFSWASAGRLMTSSAYFGLEPVVKQNDTEASVAFSQEYDLWKSRTKKWLDQMPDDFTPPLYEVYDRN